MKVPGFDKCKEWNDNKEIYISSFPALISMLSFMENLLTSLSIRLHNLYPMLRNVSTWVFWRFHLFLFGFLGFFGWSLRGSLGCVLAVALLCRTCSNDPRHLCPVTCHMLRIEGHSPGKNTHTHTRTQGYDTEICNSNSAKCFFLIL